MKTTKKSRKDATAEPGGRGGPGEPAPYDLIPPDPERCQAERPNGYSFMTLGGRPGRVRCWERPVVIATEVEADRWGRRGQMSLCRHCLGKIQELRPGVATFEVIERSE